MQTSGPQLYPVQRCSEANQACTGPLGALQASLAGQPAPGAPASATLSPKPLKPCTCCAGGWGTLFAGHTPAAQRGAWPSIAVGCLCSQAPGPGSRATTAVAALASAVGACGSDQAGADLTGAAERGRAGSAPPRHGERQPAGGRSRAWGGGL